MITYITKVLLILEFLTFKTSLTLHAPLRSALPHPPLVVVFLVDQPIHIGPIDRR